MRPSILQNPVVFGGRVFLLPRLFDDGADGYPGVRQHHALSSQAQDSSITARR